MFVECKYHVSAPAAQHVCIIRCFRFRPPHISQFSRRPPLVALHPLIMSLDRELSEIIRDAGAPEALSTFLAAESITGCALFYDCVKSLGHHSYSLFC
jgi:hypothetical protein